MRLDSIVSTWQLDSINEQVIYRGGSVQDGAPEALAPVREALGGADGHEPHRRMAGDGQHHDVEALHIVRASDALRTGSRPASISSASQP